jgi:hypothetical protein
MRTCRPTSVGWVGAAVFLFGALATSGSVLPPVAAGSAERVGAPASISTNSPTSVYDAIIGVVIKVADSGENRNATRIERIISAISIYREEEEEGSVRVEALSRGSSSQSLSIPLLAASTRQSVVAGRRLFHIAWVGGRPPFVVELIGPSGMPVATWPQTGEHSVAATVNLEAGFYDLRIVDASKQPVLGAFEASSQLPTVDQSGVEQLPPDLGAALLAARLAGMDDGAWRLEAYERLTAEPSGDAARIIAKRLAEGLSVSELRQQGAQLR